MWPMLLDYSRDECKRILRRLELEAYSGVVSAFRAQGDLSREKKKLLQDLQNMLSISVERHRAEVRRAVNDERLSTVADYNSSSMATSEWMIEGRRLVPLLPRLVPQTAFTQTANQAAKEAAEKNSHLINPAFTGNKELANQSSASTSTTGIATVAAKPSRPTSPTSNVVVLPSGTSIHIKGMLNPDEEDEQLNRRQRRSLSIESLGAATASAQTQTARVIYTTASSTPGSASPVKITISKSPQARALVSQPGGQPPKVILVTSSNQSSASTMHPRSMSVPVIRASTSTSTSQSGTTKTSIIIPGSPALAHNASMPGVVTVTTNSITTSTSGTVTMPTSVVGGSQSFTPSINIGKPRAKVVSRHRFPQPPKPGMVIPMGPGGSQPVAPTPHNIHVKTVAKPPPIHIKQDGGMKIITQSVPGASKILPKPAQLAGSPGTPVVVVNAGPSPSGGGNTTVTMVPKTVGSYTAPTGSKVLNISAPAGRVIASTKTPNVVTVNPKTLQLTAVKSAAGGTTVSKPNVIVVQKTQPRRPSVPTQIGKGGTTVITNSSAFEKELANFIQKEAGRQVSVSISPSGTVTSATATGGRTPEQHRVIITTTGNSDPNRQGTGQKLVPTDAETRTSLLAELIQASGIVADSGNEASGLGGNEWFEFDDSSHTLTSDPLPVSTVQSVMGIHNSGAKIVQRSGSVSDDQAGGSQEQYYSLEQAVSLLNAETSTPEGTAILTGQQPVQRIITSSGERIITTQSGESGKTVLGVPRRLSASLVTGQGVVQTVRTSFEGSSRSADVPGIQSIQQSGELDPQTGLFYSSGVTGQQIVVRDGSILASPMLVQNTRQPHSLAETRQVSSLPAPVQPSAQVVNRSVTQNLNVTSLPGSQTIDLISSSLAQADINLESFDFGDEEGLDPYAPLEAESGDVVVAGGGEELDDQQSLEIGEAVNFDAHTALLEESESGAIEILTSVPSVPPEVGFTNSTSLPATDIIPTPLQQQQQHVQQQQQPTPVQSSNPVSRVSSRPSTFIPLEDAKGARSSSINVVARDQRDAQAAPHASATVTSYAVVSSNSSSNAVLPSTTVLQSSKVLPASAVSTPSVSISLSSSVTQNSTPLRLSPQPQSNLVPASSRNSTDSGSVSLLPPNTAVHSSGSTFVSVANPSIARTTVAPKSGALTTSSLPQTVVIENSSGVSGLDIVPRTIGTANSVSSAVVVTSNAGVGGGKSVAVVRDGHMAAVNSQTGGHKTDSVTVLPMAEAIAGAASISGPSCSAVVDFASFVSSTAGDQDVDLITVGESGSTDRTVDGLNYDANSLRQSKRKRKPPSALEEAAGGSAGGSWLRAASIILAKVSRFRGTNREKGELNAAAWFTHPVDVADAPDYYNIIKKPMDFSTIRKKLESGHYTQFEEFHADMQLVRDNCFVYNSANTRVYQDCTQVFRFYQQEIDKLLDKSATKVPAGQTGSPPKKVIRIDKSPGKS